MKLSLGNLDLDRKRQWVPKHQVYVDADSNSSKFWSQGLKSGNSSVLCLWDSAVLLLRSTKKHNGDISEAEQERWSELNLCNNLPTPIQCSWTNTQTSAITEVQGRDIFLLLPKHVVTKQSFRCNPKSLCLLFYFFSPVQNLYFPEYQNQFYINSSIPPLILPSLKKPNEAQMELKSPKMHA